MLAHGLGADGHASPESTRSLRGNIAATLLPAWIETSHVRYLVRAVFIPRDRMPMRCARTRRAPSLLLDIAPSLMTFTMYVYGLKCVRAHMRVDTSRVQ